MKVKFLVQSLLVLYCALATLSMSAASLDANTAQSLASQFMSSRQGVHLNSGLPALTLAHAEASKAAPGQTDYYVFNATDGNAFVIVSGDDRATSILAYGESALDVDNVPCNLQWWLGEYKSQMEYLYAHPGIKQAPAQGNHDLVVEPLLPSMWSQGVPYNDLCPMQDNQRCYTGCVATAMAQVMYYWKYPAGSSPLPAYVTVEGMFVDALPETTFDWNNMLDSYNEGYSPVQGAAVAKLMRYCGQSCFMGYTPSGSGAAEEDQLAALRFYGYNPGGSCLLRDYYYTSEWEDMMLEDLAAGRPILYSGFGDSSGHAFVVDGYDGSMYHINWGWGGSYDGYFAINAFIVDGYDFTYGQKMLHQVYPDPASAGIDTYDFEVNGIYYAKNGNQATVTHKNYKYNCYKGKVSIPETVSVGGVTYTVTEIGNSAFRNCGELTSVVIPATVNTIGEHAFRNCRSMSSVTFAESVDFIETAAFEDCLGLKTVHVNSLEDWLGIHFANYDSNPLYYGPKLMINGIELTSLEVPEGVTSINDYQFLGSKRITSLNTGNTVQKIGDMAFYNCTGLTGVVMGDGMVEVGDLAFTYCSSLTSVVMGNHLKSIGVQAFYDCTALPNVLFGNALESIGDWAFGSCESLSKVALPATLRNIGYAAFCYCYGIQSLTLTGGGTIDDYAFFDCDHLSRVIMGDGVVSLGDYVFYGCTELTSVTFGQGLERVGSDVFRSSSKLSKVTISDLESWLNIQFASMYSNPVALAKKIYIKNQEVKQVVVPDAITTIKPYAFVNCTGLTSVTLHKNVSLIDNYAFSGCSGINSITSMATMPPVIRNSNCFATSTYNNAQVMVPNQSLDAYRNANIWKSFAHFQGVSMGLKGDVNDNGECGVDDITALIDFMLVGGNINEDNADVNDNGTIAIDDVAALIDLLLRGN